MLHFLNDVIDDDESTQKIDHNVIFASLIINQLGKLINRKPGLHLLISSLPGKALRKLVDITRLAGTGARIYETLLPCLMLRGLLFNSI